MDVAKMEKQPVKLIKQLSGQSKSLEELPNNQTGQPDTRIHADRWQFCRQKRSWCGLTNTPGIPTLKFLKFVQRSPLTPPPPSSPPPCYDVVINMYCEHDMTFPVACFCEWISGLQKRLRKKKQKSRKHLRDRECTKLTSDDCMSALKWFHCDPLIHSHLSQGKYEEKKSLISWCQLLSDCQLSRALSPCSLSGRMTRACRTRFVLGNMSRNMT